MDLAAWQQAFVTGGIPPCICDLTQPFDDTCGLNDLVWWQQHFVVY
jgi:hypothetical protein